VIGVLFDVSIPLLRTTGVCPMVNRYADSAWVREVEQFTGAHRHRSLRLGASGAVESY
jgi:hypothetical protein